MSVLSSTGHDLYPVGLMFCEVTTSKSQFKHNFIMYMELKKEVVFGLDM